MLFETEHMYNTNCTVVAASILQELGLTNFPAFKNAQNNSRNRINQRLKDSFVTATGVQAIRTSCNGHMNLVFTVDLKHQLLILS